MNEDALMTANAIPVDAGNRLRILFWNALDTGTLNVQCRYQILNKDGTISQNYQQLTVPTASAATAFELTLAPGYLLAVTLSTFNTILQSGDLYATISLQYGTVTDQTQQLPLMAGYVLANAPLNYPLSDIRPTNSGLPSATDNALADPGNGNDFTLQMPSTARGIIRALSWTLQTDATIAVRQVALSWVNANGEYYRMNAASSQNPNETRTYMLWTGTTPPTPPTGFIYIPAPNMPPMQGLQLVIVTTNLQGGDEHTNIRWIDEHHVAM